MQYRYIATSKEGFVQQLASNILPHGYWFFVQGRVPDGKSPEDVDEKLLARYGVPMSRQARARRKQTGLANLHYIRFERTWLLLATHGQHAFFSHEAENIRDVRKAPVHFEGYSISVKRGGYLKKEPDEEQKTADGKYRVRVQIGRERYRELLCYFGEMAIRRSAAELSRELYCVPFEPYAPVRRQLLRVLRLPNKRRQGVGVQKLSIEVLRFRRQIVRPFDDAHFAHTVAA
jgi:hypothetical protein